jgi:hypothetical protein
MRKKRMRKDEKREVTPEFVNMSKEILYPQIQGVTEDFRDVINWTLPGRALSVLLLNQCCADRMR